MNVNNHIEESIVVSESFLGLPSGSITWGVITRRVGSDLFVCVYFKLRDSEFINIMAQIEDRYNNEVDLIESVASAQDHAISRVPYVLSAYGIINLVQNIASKGLKMVYISDPNFVPGDNASSIIHMSMN